jgi:hypothetical protein
MPDLRAALPTSTAPNLAAKVEKVKGPLSHAELRKYFDTARTQCNDARIDSELSRDYFDNKQLTPREMEVLRTRGQPPIVNNIIQRAVNGILGVVEQGKTDPRALMRNPPDDAPKPSTAPPQQMGQPGQPPQGASPPPAAPLDAGDVASMALRFISDTTHFPAIKMDVLENGLIEGCGAAITEIDGDDVTVTQIRWEEFFYDPYSRRSDFKDARYMGVAKWMYADDLKALYPETADAMARFTSDGVIGGSPDTTWQDRPDTGTPWVDGGRKRCMVVEIYHQTGGRWYRAVLYAADILEYAASPYLDDKGLPSNPIEAWSCYVDRLNNRYGYVKPMRDMQDEVNMRRSKALHEINSRQVQQVDPQAIPVDVNTVRTEAAKPDGVIPSGWQVVPRQDQVANNLQMLAEAKADIERMAPNPAILGRTNADASGRAQQVRQQAGMTELAPILARLANWENRMYTQMWGRARQFWKDPKWIRVTNDSEAPQYVRINEPGPPVPGIDPATNQPAMVPGPPKNHLAQMDVDIVLEDVPDTATLEQEVFAELSQLAKVYGPQAVPFEIILEASSLPEKRKLIDKLKAYQAANAPAQQAAQQLQMAEGQAKVGKTNADALNAHADTLETQANIALKNAQAGLIEVETVTTALAGHLDATKAAQLPPGVTLDGSGAPVHIMPPPQVPPTLTGVGMQPPG